MVMKFDKIEPSIMTAMKHVAENSIESEGIVIRDGKTENYFDDNDDRKNLVSNDVKDKYHFVNISMLIMGISTLLPWNFFITASNYWMYKFKKPGTEKIDYLNKTRLQVTFESYMTVSSTVSMTVFLLLNSVIGHKFSQKSKMLASLFAIALLMIVTTVFIKIDTDSWQIEFLAITLVAVVLINAGTAFYQGTISGIGSMLPPNCMNALMNGQAIGGVFASVANILTLLNPDSRPEDAALAYFLIAIAFTVFTVIVYIFLLRSPYYKHYTSPSLTPTVRSVTTSKTVIGVMKKIWPYFFSSWFTLTVTLSTFPAVLSNSVSQSVSDGSIWTNRLFVPVVIFLLYNVSDVSGRSVSLWINFPKIGNPLLYVFAILRISIPILLLFCNRNPSQLPIIFPQDYWLVTFMIILGLTNGYSLTLNMMYAPQVVENEEQEITGNIMALSAGTGVMCGTFIGMGLVHLV